MFAMRPVIPASLCTAVVFEALTVFATQDKTVRAASPWQDDPYDVLVSFSQFTVPMLALAIGIRLLAWRAPGGEDREQQTVRAAVAMTAIITLTLAFEWAALLDGAHDADRNSWTTVLIGGLVATSALTVAVAVPLLRRLGRRTWRDDWLGDVLYLCQRIPVLRRWAKPEFAAWVRRHAMGVFVTLSFLAAVGIIGALAVGEQWTDPLLIGWALAIETSSNLVFCVISNAVAGFIARPPRSRLRRRVEMAVVVACIAAQVTTAFRDTIWGALGRGAVTTVPTLVGLTIGTGVAIFLLTLAVPVGRRHDVRY
jgi:hypothetical protein